MAKKIAVLIGVILAIIVKAFFAPYEFIGLLIVGFITGYITHGVLSGLWNGALAGALGTIICAILFILVATFGGIFADLFAGLSGFTISGIPSIVAVIETIIYYAIVMGITGAVGGKLSSKE
ncbi:DUF5518 domain-containing protein [Methanobrevibacter sp.]